MLKHLLLIVLFGLSVRPAIAQLERENLASRQFKQQLRSQYLPSDTAQAIITLYSRRQAGGVGWVIGSVLSAVRIGTAATTTPSYGGYAPAQPETRNNLGVAFLVATPFAAYGVAKLTHYSNAHLSQVLTAYGGGQPLPRALRRKLKPRFFSAPIVPYKKVPYKPAN